MKTLKKIVAILAVALMLCSILPLSVFAAAGDTHTVDFSTISGSVQYAEETHDLGGGISLHIVKCHINTQLRIYSSSSNNGIATFTSEEPIASIVINAGNKADTLNISVSDDGSTWTLDQTVATSTSYTDYTVELSAPSNYVQIDVAGTAQVRIKTMTFTFGGEVIAGCDHASLACGTTCSNCNAYTKEHKYSNTCVEFCENGCGTANADYVAGHSYTGAYDTTCNICNAIREVTFPDADSVLTIAQIAEICAGMDSGATSSVKYYVTGEITEIYNTTYGNMYITDGTDTLTIYGTYDADGTTRFDAMADQPEVGQTVKLYGKIGPYNGTAQMQYANIVEVAGGCEHEYEYECSTNCKLCGEGVRDVVCVNEGYACQDGLCTYCGGDIAGLGHAYDSDYDADCNYCGEVRDVPEAPDSATIDFSTTDQRTELDTEHQVWVEGALVLTNNKASSTSNVVDYSNPVRFYKSTELIVAFPNMAKIEFTCNTASYATTLQTAIGESATVNGTVVTVTFDEPVESYTVALTSGQVRMNSVTVYASTEQEGCDHAALACGETCANCGEYTKEHIYSNNCVAECENGCGTANPNYADHVYSGDYDTTCNTCGAAREVNLPEADSVLTIAEAIAIGQGMDHNTYTANKYYVTGVLTEVYNTTYGNMYIADAEGNTFTIYGSDYADLETKPVVGDTVTIYGAVGQYNGASQIKNGNITEVIAHTCVSNAEYECTDGTCTICGATVAGTGHSYFYPCDKVCQICYTETNPDAVHSVKHVEAVAATCAANGNIEYWYCEYCGSAWADEAHTQVTNMMSVVVPATGEHTYDDDYDADCNVCGEVREVEVPEITYGDANGDGSVNIRDVALLQQYIAGWDATLDEAAADANGDGSVNIRDVALMQQYIAGWDVTLGG